MATSFGTRKALGRRYGVDPAILLESERLQREYNLAPGREARRIQEEQFNKSLAQQQSNIDEASKNAKIAGMTGTAANLASTGMVIRGMTMKPGDSFWGNWGTQAAAEVPTGVMQGTTQAGAGIPSAYTPGFWNGPASTYQPGMGYSGAASNMAGTTPLTGGGVGATNPATIDAASSGIAPASSAVAGYGSQGGIGTGIGAMESGVMEAVPYLGAAYGLGKAGEAAFSSGTFGHRASEAIPNVLEWPVKMITDPGKTWEKTKDFFGDAWEPVQDFFGGISDVFGW